LRDVPPFPPVAARLMRLVSDDGENFNYKDVADLIRADAAFAAEVLRLANSPLFSSRHEIRDVSHAIAVMGLSRLRAAVATLAVREFMLSKRQNEAIRAAWRHNLATALACETLAGAFWLDSGFGYTSGLLHDIGLLALVVAHSGTYVELLARPTDNPSEFRTLERELLGIDHCDAGHWLLTEWELPPDFAYVAASHHDTLRSDAPDILRLVQLGCRVASMAGFSPCNVSLEWTPSQVIAELPEQKRDVYSRKLDELPVLIAANVNIFECEFVATTRS
jgi:HD-like signal output (HDOD) protein